MLVASELPSSLCPCLCACSRNRAALFISPALRCQQVHCQGVVFKERKFLQKKKKMTTTPSAHSQPLKNSET